jgi:hypothetical protein
MIMALFVAHPCKTRLILIDGKVDDAEVVFTQSSKEERQIVLAYKLVGGPVLLLTGLRAVADRLATAALLRALLSAHGT